VYELKIENVEFNNIVVEYVNELTSIPKYTLLFATSVYDCKGATGTRPKTACAIGGALIV
jgi:hypothetical protein